MIIEKLNWDTEFFGMKVGRLVIYNADEFDCHRFNSLVLDQKYQLVYVYSFKNMLRLDQVIKANLELVDIQIGMKKKFIKNDMEKINYNFREQLTQNELLECYRITEQIVPVSRFYNEPLIGQLKTIELYRKWIDNTLNKEFLDGMFLAYDEQKIIGLNLIKTDLINKLGYCSLIGVDSDYKGKGIGRQLWYQAFSYWAEETDIDTCKVNFSLKNTESFNFHLNLGFNKTEEVKFIYHCRNLNLE